MFLVLFVLGFFFKGFQLLKIQKVLAVSPRKCRSAMSGRWHSHLGEEQSLGGWGVFFEFSMVTF